jgi:hypothetical protein
MRTTPLSTASVSVSVVSWYTTPGQSMRKMRFVRFTYCHTLFYRRNLKLKQGLKAVSMI